MEPLTVYTSCRLRDSAGAIALYASAWWRGAPVSWRIAIFNADGSLNDLAGIEKITLTITDMVNGGPGKIGWLSRDYPDGELNPDLTPQEWDAREACHFEAALSGEDTLMPVEGLVSHYWVMLEARTTAGEPVPLAALQVALRSTRGPTLDRDPMGIVGILTYGGVPLVYDPSHS